MQQTLVRLEKQVTAAQGSLDVIEGLASARKKEIKAVKLDLEQERRHAEETRRERSRLIEEITRFNEEVRLKSLYGLSLTVGPVA
jgi:hypothetical protein